MLTLKRSFEETFKNVESLNNFKGFYFAISGMNTNQ